MVIEYFLEWIETASVTKRTEAASAMVRAFLRSDISLSEREDVEAALTVLLEDPAPCVRLAIAQAFGARKIAPRHIISALATDVVDVSIVTLSQSPVLHDTELCEIIRTAEEENQIAIACRPWLSPLVVKTIAHEAGEEACLAVMTNPAANISQDNLHAIAQRFGTSTQMRRELLAREDIAAETRLVLIDKLGSALSSLVSEKGWISKNKVEKVVDDACEKATITFVGNAAQSDVTPLVRNMIGNGKITVSYLMRAVCMGNISLVAHAFSELSGVAYARVETILMKDRKSAFKALYDRAGLPQTAFVIFQTAMSAWRRALESDVEQNEARLSYLVTREVLDTYTGQKDHVVDELILLLRKLSAEAARDSSRIKAAEIANRSAEADAIIEVQADVENAVEIEHTQFDDFEIDTDALIADISENIDENKHEIMQQEVLSSMDNAMDKVANSSDAFAYIDAEIIEDDYRPEISEAIMNAAMARAA